MLIQTDKSRFKSRQFTRIKQKVKSMKVQLVSCDAVKPDRYAITKLLAEIADGVDSSLAQEFTANLLEGSPVDIEIVGKKTSSATKSLRKLKIDYELMD